MFPGILIGVAISTLVFIILDILFEDRKFAVAGFAQNKNNRSQGKIHVSYAITNSEQEARRLMMELLKKHYPEDEWDEHTVVVKEIE